MQPGVANGRSKPDKGVPEIMRKSILSTPLFTVSLVLASCGGLGAGDSTAQEPVPLSAGEPVALEDGAPFAVTSHGTFAEPWAIAEEPGTGKFLITEKAGTAKLFNPADGTVLEVTSGLPEVAYGGQGGLGDVAFAPDYADSGTVYLSWAKADEGAARRAALGRGKLVCDTDSCAIEGFTQIWQQSIPIESNGHFSHKIAFSPDGQHLFLSSGDRQQQDPAQDRSNNLGAVLRLNLDGTPAAGNPFADEGSPTDQIWTYGQRNILGLKFDSAGNLWELEHGPRGGDELNLIARGANYGWPTRSNGVNYSGDDIPDHTADDGFTKPALFWTPVIAPGDMIVYSGDMFADWQDQILIANLGTTSIARIALDPANASATEEARYAFPERLRDIVEASDGAIWVIEDGDNGRLLRLTPAP